MPFRLSVAPGRYWCFRRRHTAASDKEAVSAGDDKRDNHRSPLRTAVTSEPASTTSHKFMAENITMVRAGDLSAVQMQIGTVNRCRGDAQNNIVRCLKSRVRHVVDADMMRAVISECFIEYSPREKG